MFDHHKKRCAHEVFIFMINPFNVDFMAYSQFFMTGDWAAVAWLVQLRVLGQLHFNLARSVETET